jgi:hypothetical protein
MPTSFKIAIGAAITFFGLIVLAYTLPIISNAAASNGPVFSELNVPKYPDDARIYIPIAIGGAGLLAVGISFMAVGLNERMSMPETIQNDKTGGNEITSKSGDNKSKTTEAA